LDELWEACRRLAVDRQELLHEWMGPEYDHLEYVAYLYRDCAVSFQVLAAVAKTESAVKRL
jgi:hypothetical protein